MINKGPICVIAKRKRIGAKFGNSASIIHVDMTNPQFKEVRQSQTAPFFDAARVVPSHKWQVECGRTG